ncbi:MAG: 1,6-anhydro-N-acetylmuramyl-L-alanine amidase AmpD [Burkholderiaceae bacterium]
MPRRFSRSALSHRNRSSHGPGVWQAGWLRQARQVLSPNFGPRPAGCPVSLLVLHSISLPPGQYGGGQIQALFSNQLDWNAHPYFQTIRGLQVSAHFLIARDGTLWQFVSCDDRAWHAGTSSFRGRDNCNDFSIGVELEGLEGDVFEQDQYATLSQLCKSLHQHYPIASVVGHEHIASGRKRDPGPGFDWSLLAQSVAWSPQLFPFLSNQVKN